MRIFKLLKLLRMIRLLLAQESLLSPDFKTYAPFYLRVLRGVLVIGAPRFSKHQRSQAQNPQEKWHALSDNIRKLGPSYIKLGQFLATRPDMIGDAMAADLSHLQDRLPPFSEEQVVKILHVEFDDYTAHIADLGPAIAAASVAQVHKVRHRVSGDPMAIKILRPAIEKTLAAEFSAFLWLARICEAVLPATRRLRPVAVVETLARTVRGETDLRMEAAALSEMAANTQNDEKFLIPQIIWESSSRRVLAMQWIDGVPASDIAALRAAGHDMSDLAIRLIRIFLTLALRDGFFHADMHQGNVLVQPDGTLVAIDLGITGRLDADSRHFLADILHGFITRDYYKVAQVHMHAGYVPNHHDIGAFAQALRAIGEPIRDQSADNISMARLLTQLFEVTGQFGMQTQPQLLLLQKTMVTVEGLARSFDPDLNFWDAAEPVVAGWLKQQSGPEAIIRTFRENAGRTLHILRRLPDILAQAERGAAALESMAKNGANDMTSNMTGYMAGDDNPLVRLGRRSWGTRRNQRHGGWVSWLALAVALGAIALTLV